MVPVDQKISAGNGPASQPPPEGVFRLTKEDEVRAQMYLLLAQLLYASPSQEVIDLVGGLKGDDTEFGQAIEELTSAARSTSREQIDEEFGDLFVGVPTPLLMPYASYYLAGSMFGRPLAKLRIDMVRLGIARQDRTTEPEDHIGSLCEMMAGLILGEFGGEPAALSLQRLFFEKHIADWAPQFFSDLSQAKPADFFRRVARLGSTFLEIERQAFKMVA